MTAKLELDRDGATGTSLRLVFSSSDSIFLVIELAIGGVVANCDGPTVMQNGLRIIIRNRKKAPLATTNLPVIVDGRAIPLDL